MLVAGQSAKRKLECRDAALECACREILARLTSSAMVIVVCAELVDKKGEEEGE